MIVTTGNGAPNREPDAVYLDHKIWIELDREPDNIKAFHYVEQPDGNVLFADITPYDQRVETVMRWIDAGYPARTGSRPLHREDLIDDRNDDTEDTQVLPLRSQSDEADGS
jgi:hypothetical protein